MHCWFAATGCPGPYLKARFSDIANRVNAILGSSNPNPVPVPSGNVAVGDIVTFLGGSHYYSADASSPSSTSLKAGKAKVTAIYKRGKHPYHLIHTDNQTSVYGWVDASQIEGASSAPSGPSVETFNKGDRVKIRSSTTRWVGGASIPSWVKNSQLYICNFRNSDPCVTINSDLSGVTGVLKTSDLYHN